MSPHILLCDTLTHNHKLFLSLHVFLPSSAFEQLLLLQSLSTTPHGQETRRELHISSSPLSFIGLSGGSQVRELIPSVSCGLAWHDSAGASSSVSSSTSGLTMLGAHGAVTPAGLFLKINPWHWIYISDAPLYQCFNWRSVPSGFEVLRPFSSLERSLHFSCALPDISR